MNDKLKNRILRLVNRLLASLMLGVGMACCGSLTVYGVEEGLTEEEVKQQVVEIIEEENRGEITDYTIVEYDIEKIYPIISLDFFVNDYIDGMTFGEIIEKQEKVNKVENQCVNWMLPYMNHLDQNCLATFLDNTINVDIVTRTVDTEIVFDMKIYDGKFEDVDFEKVKKTIYLNLAMYGFKVTYVCMNNGEEYVIPYLRGEVEKWSGLECEKIYRVDEFVISIYNCYEERKEVEEMQEKANMNTIVSERKRKLKCTNIAQVKKIEWIKDNIILIFFVFALCIVGIYLILRIYRKKRM